MGQKKRTQTATPTAPFRVGGFVEILCGLHRGDRGPVVGADEENVLVDVHDMPHSYRHEDVRKVN